ncbi:MAG TPA: hypothetical protein VFB13_10250 [Reyranella sp.]|jgi:hypothetical protein|nr:hypothetical protein [Reyranella sp.]
MTMRSPLWFLAAAVIAVAGFVGAFFYVAPRIAAFSAGLQQVVMPGPAIVTLNLPGAYTIYAEVGGLVDGRLYDNPPPNGARITVSSEASGKQVALGKPTASVEYSVGSRKGHAVLDFTIDQPGRYRLAAAPSTDAPYVLAIAYGSPMGSVGGLFKIVMVAVAMSLSGLGVAGVIVVVTVIQRSRAKRAVGAT